jgi:peptidyl-prolyl cis-trans isomerase B (cyclophilin B)
MANTTVKLHTTQGEITIELYEDKAPKTTQNFLQYVNEGFYNNTLFHRVIKNFMIQGGGFTPKMVQKETHDPIVNESDNGLSNERGTIAMARTSDPNSATSQFFINHADNDFLNCKKAAGEPGYAVFGKVTDGMDVVDAIAAVPTTSRGGYEDTPAEPVVIEKAEVETN